ncbi:MAG: polysaccharide biosynthesis/export family protein, partial [Acidobacteria bacterium]|nr:polysaccharide biosynthesis/export family protein [Acidobacteriota bacterium]
MKTQSKNEFNRSSRVTGQLVSGFLSIAMIASPAAGQQQSQERRTPSITNELAVQNSRRVAAPAGEIEAVLRRDAGILVELKRWVAKEATDRGQLVDDAAMTDSAIFARLQADLEFRSTATQLLQRYGYLLPKMNPDSEMAQEQKLLLEERVRRIAKARDRDEEEERARMQREQQTDSRLDRTSNREGLRDRDGREIPSSESGRSKKSEPQRRDRDSVQTADSQVNSGLSEFEVPPGQDRALTEIPNQSSSQLQRIAQAVGKNAGNSALGENRLTGDPESDTTDSRLRRSHTSERTSTDRMTESRETEAGELRRTRMSDGMGEETELSRSGMVRRPNPYSNIPSLYEMYAQAKSKPGDLKRFGLDALRNSDTDLDRLPMDLPVGPDYVVGPGDGLSINLWGGVSQRISRIVDREGRINLPEAGPVLVSGKSMGEVQQS